MSRLGHAILALRALRHGDMARFLIEAQNALVLDPQEYS